MSRRDPHRWARFASSVATLVALAVVVPIGLVAVSRARFGSANPLAGADPPWRWGSQDVGDALSGPLADDTVIDGIVRVSLCVVWVAVAMILVTTIVEVVHAVRHHGLAFPDVRGAGWAQSIARFIAIGFVAVLPMMTPASSLASALGARAAPTAAFADPVVTAPMAGTATFDVAVPRTAPAPGAVHVVAAGESIYSIARVPRRRRLEPCPGDRRCDHRRQPRRRDAGWSALHQSRLRGGRLAVAAARRRGRRALGRLAGGPRCGAGRLAGCGGRRRQRRRRPCGGDVHRRGGGHPLGHRRRATGRSDGMAGDLGTPRRRRHGRRPGLRGPEPDPARLETRTCRHRDDRRAASRDRRGGAR